MTVFERAIGFWRKEAEEGSLSQIPFSIFGPICLICTFALSAKVPMPFDLLFLALSGLYLSARWQMRGFVYSLILLALGGGIKHFLLDSGHLWQLGIEGSLAISFFITALSFEESSSFIQSLISQMDASSSVVRNLEEEISAVREQATAQQMALQEKVAVLQKELEELQTDHSSILILNEVLRKTSARHAEEKEALGETSLNQKAQISILQLNLETVEKELKRLSNSESLIVENKQLTKELNAARLEREQTHLINETLARLHAKESLKAKELSEQIHAVLEEKQKTLQQLGSAQSEVEMFTKRLEQMALERENARVSLMQMADIKTEKNFLQERLKAAEAEIALLKQKSQDPLLLAQLQDLQNERVQFQEQIAILQQKTDVQMQELIEQRTYFQEQILDFQQKADARVQELQNERLQFQEQIALLHQKAEEPKAHLLEEERAHFQEQIAYAQERLQTLSQIEPLFNQLKKQFEEKNQILHQTRSEFFKADTELQTLRMEREQNLLQLNPVPKDLLEELANSEEEIERLEEENKELLELVTLLNTPKTSPLGEKKK